MLTRIGFASVALATGLLVTTAAPAAALDADDFGPISDFGANGQYPAIAGGPADGTALVVFDYDDPVGDTDGIYGQFVNSEFGIVGSPFLLSDPDGDSGNEPPTAEWNPDRQEWLVVWEDTDRDTGDEVINGRIVVPGTGASGSIIRIADNHQSLAFSDTELAYSAYAADQDVYLTVFKSTVDASFSCQAAFGVFVNSDGTVPTTDATVFSTTDVNACDPQIDNGANVAYSAASDRWVVGFGYRSRETGVVSVENVGGVPTPSTPEIVGDNSNAVHPGIEHDSSRDRFFVGWHHRPGSTDLVQGALVTPSGTASGPSFSATPADADGDDQRAPRIHYDAASDLFLMVNHIEPESDDVLRYIAYWELPGATASTVTAPAILSDPALESTRPGITTAGDCVLVVWQADPEGDDNELLQGRSSCFTPELAATGASDASTAAITVGALALVVLGGILVAARRRAIA